MRHRWSVLPRTQFHCARGMLLLRYHRLLLALAVVHVPRARSRQSADDGALLATGQRTDTRACQPAATHDHRGLRLGPAFHLLAMRRRNAPPAIIVDRRPGLLRAV